MNLSNPFDEAIRDREGQMLERYLRAVEQEAANGKAKVELEKEQLEMIKEAAKKREAKLTMYDGQLEHINKQLLAQTGPENILKLAQAEEIIYSLRDKEERKYGTDGKTEQGDQV